MISLAVELLLLLPAAGQPGFIMALCALWGITVLVFNVSFQSETIRCTDEQSSSVAMSIFPAFSILVSAQAASLVELCVTRDKSRILAL